MSSKKMCAADEGASNLEALPRAESVARAILERCDIRHLPVDLYKIVGLWRDLRLDYDDIDNPGYLIRLGQAGSEILVRRGDPVERRRYTIAHELGHWILDKEHSGAVNDISDIERWCERFAAELLMPEGILLDYLRIGGNSALAERIAKGHSRFGVSQEAFRLRVCEVAPVLVLTVAKDTKEAVIVREYRSRKLDPRQISAWTRELLEFQAREQAWPIRLDNGFARCGSYLFHGDADDKERWLLCLYPQRKPQ